MSKKKIISTHPAHKHEVATTGKAVINGILFTAGEEGLPTSEDVHESKCEMFVGVPGFRFIDSEDGRLVGETGFKDNRTSLDAITSALNSGDITLEELRRMDLMIPGLGSLNGAIDRALDPMNARKDAASESAAEQGAETQPAEGEQEPAEQGEGSDTSLTDLAAQLGVPESDVQDGGDVIILTGEAAEQAAQGEAAELQGQEDAAPAEGELTKAQIKDRLADLGISFTARDTRDELLAKLNATLAAAQG